MTMGMIAFISSAWRDTRPLAARVVAGESQQCFSARLSTLANLSSDGRTDISSGLVGAIFIAFYFIFCI